jgi:hypothetical protein
MKINQRMSFMNFKELTPQSMCIDAGETLLNSVKLYTLAVSLGKVFDLFDNGKAIF